MQLIGKMDDYLVFEVERGKYIVVEPDSGRWSVEWTWYGQLGKWCEDFTKCNHDEDEGKCLEVIEKNKDEILERLNDLERDDEISEEFLSEQDEFYDQLEEGREYDWFSGYQEE